LPAATRPATSSKPQADHSRVPGFSEQNVIRLVDKWKITFWQFVSASIVFLAGALVFESSIRRNSAGCDVGDRISGCRYIRVRNPRLADASRKTQRDQISFFFSSRRSSERSSE